MDIAESLIRFGEDQIRTLGKARSKSYLKRCFDLWQTFYGEAVATKVRAQLTKTWKEAK